MPDHDFDAFYEMTAPTAYRLALALIGDPHGAQDLTQTVFERLYRHWRRLHVEDPHAYVKTVVARTLISDRRRARWTQEQLAADPSARLTQQDFSGTADEQQLLLHALHRLPLRQRQSVVLRYLEDMSVADVADLMQCSAGTVKRSSFDGLRNLRMLLSETILAKD